MIDSWQLWAKTSKADPSDWHALPWHLLEVGAVSGLLWQKALPQQSKDRICTRLGLNEEEAGRFVGFLASLHDLGKASPRFQNMASEQVKRLSSLYGAEFPIDANKTALRHSLISWGLLVPLFQQEFGWTTRISKRYAEITAAHHGRFWTSGEYDALKGPDTVKRTGQKAWAELHRDIFRHLREAFAIDDAMVGKLNADLISDSNFPTYEDSLWLAGLISVADWIGSDEHYFEFRSEPAESYAAALVTAQKSAEKALIFTGWASPPLTIASEDLASTILTIPDFVPRRSQSQAVDLTRSMSRPGMTVVEIPMGWGKTEIALWIAAYYAETAGITGTYFALPTMATSDQLYQRVRAHLKAHADKGSRTRIVPLHLLHGMAEFSAMDEMEQGDAEDSLQAMAERIDALTDPDADPKDQVVDAHNVVRRARWFTRKKHGLLARYGVGTVDQALMSVLLTPHLFVRMFGLSGKTVIFDEVHSYDVYMSSLFDRLLEFLGAMGSPVVILSATLPRHRTKEMLAAYARGAKWSAPSGELAAYPRISAIDNKRMQSIGVERNADDEPTTLQLEWYPSAPESMWDDLAIRLEDELQDGGTVAVICNTVTSAQACFTRLQQAFTGDVTLFHARFRQKERAAIQNRVLDLFGKDAGEDGKPNRPQRHIVVATQVIEQSLDLDFDLMVSMFAPTDLLLQRAGRLQRHRRWDDQRPAAFHKPRLWLIGIDGIDAEEGPEFFRGSKIVYGDYVLLRSWLALAGRDQIVIPDDVETLIEATYGDNPVVPDGVGPRYIEAEAAWLKATRMDQKTSESVLIPDLDRERLESRTDVLVRLTQLKQDPEEVPEAHQSRLALTRLGGPTVSLVVLTEGEARSLSFDPNGDVETPFTNDQVRTLLHHAVSMSSYDVVRAALEMEVPPAWEQSAHLRYRRLILLDADGEATFGKAVIRLDDCRGVLIVRESANEGAGGEE